MDESLVNHQWMQMKEKRTEDDQGKTTQGDEQVFQPKISWDFGTAYDLFISLYVLHHPDVFGLRPPWAAGVRSRLTSEERRTLEIAQDGIYSPFHWI